MEKKDPPKDPNKSKEKDKKQAKKKGDLIAELLAMPMLDWDTIESHGPYEETENAQPIGNQVNPTENVEGQEQKKITGPQLRNAIAKGAGGTSTDSHAQSSSNSIRNLPSLSPLEEARLLAEKRAQEQLRYAEEAVKKEQERVAAAAAAQQRCTSNAVNVGRQNVETRQPAIRPRNTTREQAIRDGNCVVFMDIGKCKYGDSCRYKHPENRAPPVCPHWDRFGKCTSEKFHGRPCRYYHYTGTDADTIRWEANQRNRDREYNRNARNSGVNNNARNNQCNDNASNNASVPQNADANSNPPFGFINNASVPQNAGSSSTLAFGSNNNASVPQNADAISTAAFGNNAFPPRNPSNNTDGFANIGIADNGFVNTSGGWGLSENLSGSGWEPAANPPANAEKDEKQDEECKEAETPKAEDEESRKESEQNEEGTNEVLPIKDAEKKDGEQADLLKEADGKGEDAKKEDEKKDEQQADAKAEDEVDKENAVPDGGVKDEKAEEKEVRKDEAKCDVDAEVAMAMAENAFPRYNENGIPMEAVNLSPALNAGQYGEALRECGLERTVENNRTSDSSTSPTCELQNSTSPNNEVESVEESAEKSQE